MSALRTALVSFVLGAAACGGRTPTRADEPMDAGADAKPEPEPELLTESDKLDVLFVIDNSKTARFAHRALATTIPYFIDRLLDPRCVNGLGQIVDTPIMGADCAVGRRDFAPLRDIHIGVISTSIGGHGADTCSAASSTFNADEDDRAHLLTRNDAGGQVPSYAGLGFLAWDPDQAKTPPGDSDRASYEAKLIEVLEGVGPRGCGFEAPLEAFYRFLIDPAPYEQIVNQGGSAVATGVDERLLEQRAAFLRPDSAVLIVLLSDEDDCSIRDGGQSFYAAQSDEGNFHLPRARAVCATDPDDPCCNSCGAAVSGCPDDPTCDLGPLSAEADPLNLRCFDQKRRFGIDFTYPIDRYVEGLTQARVTTYLGEVADNPLFVQRRSPEMIMVAAIAGVPWQDIALNAQSPAAGFTPTAEIPWDRILGSADTPPSDPLMIPSRTPRSGSHPVTNDAVAPPESGAEENPINGHEHLEPTDLQFACIYPLEEPVVCVDADCECLPSSMTLNPVCQQRDGSYSNVQRFGRATPATRQLTLLRELPSRSALGSVCTTDDFNPSAPGFGYKPTVDAILRTLRRSLVKPAL